MKASKSTWTRPYCGITHNGNLSDPRRVTVRSLREDLHILVKIERKERGNGFVTSTEESTWDSLRSAKQAGEYWMVAGNALNHVLLETLKDLVSHAAETPFPNVGLKDAVEQAREVILKAQTP